jgi:hypothetical protein
MERTIEDLRRFSNRLVNEMKVHRAVALRLNEYASGARRDDFAYRNALIESFAVRARALLQFLYPPSVKPRDASAEHFFAEGEWNRVRPDFPKALSVVERRVGQEIAHFSYANLDVMEGDARYWDFATIHWALSVVLNVFAELVPEKHVVEGFRDKAREQIEGWIVDRPADEVLRQIGADRAPPSAPR